MGEREGGVGDGGWGEDGGVSLAQTGKPVGRAGAGGERGLVST